MGPVNGEKLALPDAEERRHKLAADYAADRTDTPELLRDLEDGQLQILGDESD